MMKKLLLFAVIYVGLSQSSFAQGWVIVFTESPLPTGCSGNPLPFTAALTFNSTPSAFNFSGISTTLAPVTDARGNTYMGIISGTANLNIGNVDPSINFVISSGQIQPHTEF